MNSQPSLKSLHSQEVMILSKLAGFRKWATPKLIESLLPGKEGSLKARPDGTMMDGHHRITILRERGVDVDVLPRETIERHEIPEMGGLSP